MTTLFISYARANKSVVNLIVQELHDWGFTVWIDVSGIKGGSTWSPQIAKAIRECDFFLLFVSQASTTSDNVRREVDLAFRNGKPIIPLRLEKVDIPLEWDYQTAGIQWIECDDPDWKSRLLVALGEENQVPAEIRPPIPERGKERQKPAWWRWVAILASALVLLALLVVSFGILKQFLAYFVPTPPAPTVVAGRSMAFEFATLVVEPTATQWISEPEAFVRRYFEILTGERNYQLAWSLLTPSFQGKNSPGGYDSYVSLWKNIDKVSINSISFYENTETSAKCNANLTYSLNNGNTETYEVKYHLIFDKDRQTWLFASP